jgi:hypothetical protein
LADAVMSPVTSDIAVKPPNALNKPSVLPNIAVKPPQ